MLKFWWRRRHLAIVAGAAGLWHPDPVSSSRASVWDCVCLQPWWGTGVGVCRAVPNQHHHHHPVPPLPPPRQHFHPLHCPHPVQFAPCSQHMCSFLRITSYIYNLKWPKCRWSALEIEYIFPWDGKLQQILVNICWKDKSRESCAFVSEYSSERGWLRPPDRKI